MRAFLGYSGARLLLFAVCWGVLWLIGAKSWLGALLALVISGLLSYVLLDKLRTRLAHSMTSSWRDLKRRFQTGRAAEDDEQPVDAEPADEQRVEDQPADEQPAGEIPPAAERERSASGQ